MKTRQYIKILMTVAAVVLPTFTLAAERHIEIKPQSGDMTRTLQKAIDRAARYSAKGEKVILRLLPGEYNISKTYATPVLYHVSNTTSTDENPDPTKHIGMLFKGINNLTVNADGARIITHGEMTPWAIDDCDSITLRGFTVDASDPSVPEMTVVNLTDSSLIARPEPTSKFRINDSGEFFWIGEGWEFTDGIAQIYDPDMRTTLRCPSPVAESHSVRQYPDGTVEFIYGEGNVQKDARIGVTYQMRHSFRTEVAGFINRSRNVKLEALTLHFMGNFGIVAQMSENITYTGLTCAPDPEGTRTCAGFADFLQISGCRGLVSITDSKFAGAHDDPINVHGTHLRVVGHDSPSSLTVRFMHPQTFGFEAFLPGDSIQLVNDATLLAEGSPAVVKKSTMLNDYEMRLDLESEISFSGNDTFVVENLTWTPSVEISRNSFTLTPTRGILVSTFRPVRITNNEFLNIPMPSILIADDARSWYESGPVRDVLIQGNRFINCSAPQIQIDPQVYKKVEGEPVHSGIVIQENQFKSSSDGPFAGSPMQIKANNTDNILILDNKVSSQMPTSIILTDCNNVTVK